MIINYYAENYCKLQVGDKVVAIDPMTNEKGVKVARFGADYALLTNRKSGDMVFDTVTYSGKEPFKIYGPGDYELGDLRIRGYALNADADGYARTAYLIDWDGLQTLILGDITSKEDLPTEITESIDSVDLLIIPINSGEIGKINGIVANFSPSYVIPVGHTGKSDSNLVKFAKDFGVKDVEFTDKFTVKSKDISGIEGQVIFLSN